MNEGQLELFRNRGLIASLKRDLKFQNDKLQAVYTLFCERMDQADAQGFPSEIVWQQRNIQEEASRICQNWGIKNESGAFADRFNLLQKMLIILEQDPRDLSLKLQELVDWYADQVLHTDAGMSPKKGAEKKDRKDFAAFWDEYGKFLEQLGVYNPYPSKVTQQTIKKITEVKQKKQMNLTEHLEEFRSGERKTQYGTLANIKLLYQMQQHLGWKNFLEQFPQEVEDLKITDSQTLYGYIVFPETIPPIARSPKTDH